MLSEKVRTARKLANLSIQSLSEKTQLHPLCIGMVEAGDYFGVSSGAICVIADALGLDSQELLADYQSELSQPRP